MGLASGMYKELLQLKKAAQLNGQRILMAIAQKKTYK